MNMKILILCTGNSCRSQMAEGFLKQLDSDIQVFSAGTQPAEQVNSYAIQVMKEIGIDISKNKPKNVAEFLDTNFDYVITVCDDANETCPVFIGKVKHRLHIGFDDPAKVTGTPEEIISAFRKVRNEIQDEFKKFYHSIIK